MPKKTGFAFPSVGVVCAVGFISVIAVMFVALRPGAVQEIPGPSPLGIPLILGIVPTVLGIVTDVVAARTLKGTSQAIVLILGLLLVVWPVWAVIGTALLSCLVGPLGLMVCD
jgi:hypothetical protein